MGQNASSESPTVGRSSSVDHIVQNNDIVVFQRAGCPYCDTAINKLQSAGYNPTVIEATPDQRSELAESTKSGSVPSVWVKGKYVGGCNDGPEPWMGVTKILNNNKMNDLLK